MAEIGLGRRIMGLVGAAGIAVGALAGLASAQPAPDPKPPAPQPAPTPAPAPKAEAPPAKLPSADEIMDKFLAATGGKENWAKVKTLTMSGTLDIPSAGIKGKMASWVGENGKSLSTIDLAGFGEVKEGSDGDIVWSIDPNTGPRIVTGEERELRLAITKLSNPLDWKKLFKKIEVTGEADVDKKPAYKVVGTIEAGKTLPITQYFDKETGLVTKMELTMSGPEGEVPMEMFPSNYTEVGGVKMPYKSRRVVMKMIEMNETIEKMEVNVEIPAEKFALPAEIKELKDAAAKPKADKPATDPAPKPEKK